MCCFRLISGQVGFRHYTGITQGAERVLCQIGILPGCVSLIYPLMNDVIKVSIAKRQQVYLDLSDKGSGLAVHFYLTQNLPDTIENSDKRACFNERAGVSGVELLLCVSAGLADSRNVSDAAPPTECQLPAPYA